MNRDWNKIKTNFAGLRGLSTIGLSDIVGNTASAIFWFYMATLLQAENYGYVGYVLALGGLASTISLAGSGNILSTYIPKNVKIEGPMFVISLSIVIISSTVLFVMNKNPYLVVWLVGAVIYGLGGSEIIARKLIHTLCKISCRTKITDDRFSDHVLSYNWKGGCNSWYWIRVFTIYNKSLQSL